jgi:hypothetical protein
MDILQTSRCVDSASAMDVLKNRIDVTENGIEVWIYSIGCVQIKASQIAVY